MNKTKSRNKIIKVVRDVMTGVSDPAGVDVWKEKDGWSYDTCIPGPGAYNVVMEENYVQFRHNCNEMTMGEAETIFNDEFEHSLEPGPMDLIK